MTKDIGAHVTWQHHPGIIRVTCHRMKVSECVRISYVSNRLQCDYLRMSMAGAAGDQAGMDTMRRDQRNSKG